ncbi:MAG: organic solvent tolerance protein OstA, partial [Planctomycetia bacterium]|nr:organic solvent tolerance protein OstA [Planctomycetia bacterium]
PPPGTRRLRAFPRSDVRVQAEWFPDTASNEWVAVISGGVNLIIDGADKLGSIDISTDRLVIWTRGMEQPDLGGQTVQRDDTPLEVYMEGNIVFRQADRVVTAKAMYYDVRNHVGMILDAELLGTVQKFEGKLRLQASVLRQTAQDRFVAQGARFTTSRMGEPGYWIQGENLEIQDHPQPAVNPITGEATVDPRTGQPLIEHDWQMTASDDYLFVEGLPVFYWPTLTTDLDDPGFYLKQIKFKSDNVFGQQIWTDWNPYQLLGFKKPIKGTTWDLGFDYLSDRGPAVSTKYTYTFPSLAGLGGPTKGVLDAFYIHDDGVDNLGRDYRAVVPSTTERGRLLYNNRQSLGDGFEWIGELGIVSDRNFLQQYYQREWWTSKDEDTDLRIRRSVENRSWTVMGQMQLEHFFTTTSWLPRADHYWIGESILGDHFTWFEHSSAAYAQYRPETIPPNEPAFQLLPWQVASTGSRFSSRQEIDLPVDIGVVKVVPYALGELTHWGEDLNGQPLDRAYGQVGIRANLPMWKVDPTVESDLWNVHGLAHKVDFQAQFSYSDANQDVTQLPLYDPIDDDSIEQFRNFYPFYDFPGGTIPSQFDPRFYAIRAGLADWVTSPSTELADDLTALRLGVHQRWQTKRGEPGAQHIVDWITFDTDLVLYPNQNQDNFGALVGLIDYNFSWHVGDRFTLLSEGLFDTFSQGQQLVSVGGLLHRPDLGSVYLGVQSLEGPISSQVLIATINYRMSEKWITSFTTSLSIGGSTNTTQQLTFTRIGESFLVKLGVYSDEGQGTFGAKLAIEPRFFRSAAHNQIDGIHVPPAGALGTLD